ncbi:DegT/DnrJ/EryC1/StrS family aminotransferase [Leptospira santarosai]|uniref:DegT/DnrJ/EryC1/StrS family aminotransferase n=1 Tax=Leptospira santarosai TaxID=28183 RepID=UPI0002982A29|nr:DegT/DnrJ/EryC1/StrS family aminotransferase [Leptospira santarosai]EKS07980.1 pleiotropic regulatory protein DegT family protein [Leptospira santarosai str. JET]
MNRQFVIDLEFILKVLDEENKRIGGEYKRILNSLLESETGWVPSASVPILKLLFEREISSDGEILSNILKRLKIIKTPAYLNFEKNQSWRDLHFQILEWAAKILDAKILSLNPEFLKASDIVISPEMAINAESSKQISFVDLKAQYFGLNQEIDRAIDSVIHRTAFIGGSGNGHTKEFEEKFSDFLGIKHCISCANGTDSLEILLKSFGIGVGDEVIVPALSWISTSESVSNVGAKPVFVDIEENHYTIDCNLIEEKITTRTKAIIPVHLYGHPADMNRILELAGKYNLFVLEDCAQAHGAEYEGRLVGTIGHAGSFSFFPGKNLGAYGDAGGIVTQDDEIASKARMIANHGQKEKHNHILEGRNSRMDGIQASVLNVKLPRLKKWTDDRRKNSETYRQELQNQDLLLPKEAENVKHVYHLFVIRSKKRIQLQSALKKEGVETSIHYPTPLPFLTAYSQEGYSKDDFPVAVRCCEEILSLPMFPELSKPDIQYISNIIKKELS